MSVIVPIDHTLLMENPPFSQIWKKHTEITKEHCNSLLSYLYSGYHSWTNPITRSSLIRESPTLVSFLSVCYYNINNCYYYSEY